MAAALLLKRTQQHYIECLAVSRFCSPNSHKLNQKCAKLRVKILFVILLFMRQCLFFSKTQLRVPLSTLTGYLKVNRF